MGRVSTNATPMRFSLEETPGVLFSTPLWKAMERENLSAFGETLNKERRTPVSTSRRNKRGTGVSTEAPLGFDTDLTMDTHVDFLSSFLYTTTVYPFGQAPIRAGALFDNLDVDTGAFTHDTITTAIPAGTIIVASGFTNSGNNGVFVVDSGGTTTSTPVIAGTPLGPDETPGNTSNATIEIAGVRTGAGDLSVTVNAGVTTIVSSGVDWTDYLTVPGGSVHIGTAGTAAINNFSTAANVGPARVVSISATNLVIERTSATFVAEAAGSQEVDILFGPVDRDVNIEDPLYKESTYHFELALPNLGSGGAVRYQYAEQNYPNECTINSPSQGKMTCAYTFLGSKVGFPVAAGSRLANAADSRRPVLTDAINTGPDAARLRIDLEDGTGLTTDFVSWSIVLGNNLEPEPVQGQFGPKFFNVGDFQTTLNAQVIFSEEAVIEAIRCQRPATADFVVRNGDGAILYDLLSLELGGGGRDFPRNRSVLLNMENNAVENTQYDAQCIVTRFPLYPPDDDC